MQETLRVDFVLLSVCLLISPIQTLSTFSYSFSNQALSPIKQPSYPLGRLAANETIDWKIQNWASTVTLSSMTVKIVYAVNLTQVGTLTKACGSTSSCSGLFLIAAAGEYYIKLEQMMASSNFMMPFYLVVNSYPGNRTFVGNPLERQLLRIGDVLRANNIGKLLYSNQVQTITLSLYPLPANISSYAFVMVLPIDMGTYAYNVMDMMNYPSTYVSYTNQIYKATVDLKKGFYLLAVSYTTETPFLTVTWQANNYACTYDPSYSDYYSLCQGCSFSLSQPGLPCKVYNNVTRVCTECISGYTLDAFTGSCLADVQCLTRQYYHFGSCLPVDVRCGNFDPFTGNCLTCANASLALANGVCSLITVVCTARQWQSGIECRDVSENCDTFDPSNGQCLSCKNYTFELQKGACVPLVLVCPPGQYEVNFGCLSIPAECLRFDTANRVCLTCIQGYYVQGGECQRIVCPPNQVPSRFGLFCIDVSPLCSTFDPLNGDCLQCKAANLRIDSTGNCVQSTQPIAGCKERQRLGFGVCLNAEKDCKAYNLVTGNCDECEKGFFIDYTGHCQREAQCGVGRWSVNGECLGTPENCLRTNSLGLCDLCVNADYRLEGGACVRVRRCAAGQFLNAGGQCVDVSAECGLFNPSNGECVTCKSGANPHLGHCCVAGSVFDGSACVAESVLQSVRSSFTGSECLAFHPSLGYCLNCNQGYTVDPITQTTCTKQ